METLNRIKEYLTDTSSWYMNIYIIGGTLALLILTFIFINGVYPVLKRKREKTSLFNTLGELNRLSAPEARMLYRMAGMSRMDEPAMIFVKRSLFEDVAHTMGSPDAVEALRRKIYL